MAKSRENKSQAMLEAPISRLIPQMALPTIVAQLITVIYNLVDTYFVSSLGTNATAAVGVNNALERTVSLIAMLLASGACSYIARLLGAKRQREANEVLSASFFIGLLSGVVVMAIGLIFMRPLVYLLGATEECATYAMQYAQYVLIASPFFIVSLILNMCLRSEGRATFAMIGMGIGGILNCFLDPLFIFKFNLGVSGASMATGISKFVSFVILLIPYLRKRCSVDIALKYFKIRLTAVKEVLAIGSTSFFRTAFQVVASIVTNHVAGGFSTSALAAISVANRIMEFPFAIVLGFGQGYQPVAGFNWGARRFDRVRESLTFSSIVSIVGAIVIGVILFVFARPIIQLFEHEADGNMLSIGMLCVRLQCIALPIHAWVSIINMFFAGIGKARYALLISTSRQGYCLIPVLLIVPAIFGVKGIAASQAVADYISLFVAVPLAVVAYKMISKEQQLDAAKNANSEC